MKRYLTTIILLLLTCFLGAAQDTLPPDLPGQIAYIGTDHNVYVTGDGAVTALTTDSSTTRRYQWPTWARDGRLAYFCCDIRFENRPTRLETYIVRSGDTRGKLIYEQLNEGFTYAAWSPAGCETSAECLDLAVLVTRPNVPFKVEIIRDEAAAPSTRTVGSGAPFYITWSADGAKMAWQRNSEAITLYDAVADREIVTLDEPVGVMQAPVWSPVDERYLFTAANPESGSDIVVGEGDSVRVLHAGVVGLIGLSWSPDGRYIAYSVLRSTGESALVVVDPETAEVISATRTRFLLAHFWSPDGRKIALVTPTTDSQQGASVSIVQQQPIPLLTWAVLEVESGLVQQYAGWVPANDMVYLLTYFDQFAQSHRVWSPDSRYLVYSVVDDVGVEQVTILDTAAPDTLTYTLAEGRIGIWSY